MIEVTLAMGVERELAPTRVQFFNAKNKLCGEAFLGPSSHTERVRLDVGRYSLRIEETGKTPTHVSREINEDTELDVEKILYPEREYTRSYAAYEFNTDEEPPRRSSAIRGTLKRERSVSPPTARAGGRRKAREAAIDDVPVADFVELSSFRREAPRFTGVPEYSSASSVTPVEDHGFSYLTSTNLDSGAQYLGELLADYTKRRTPDVQVVGAGVANERSGVTLPDYRSIVTFSNVKRAPVQLPKLRARYRFTPSAHAKIFSAIKMDVKSSEIYPGDLLKILPHSDVFEPGNIQLERGFRAPLVWLQERKADVSAAKFVAIPLFHGGIELGFDKANREVLGLSVSESPYLSGIVATLASNTPVSAHSIAEQTFGLAEFRDGMELKEFAFEVLRQKFQDPFAAAAAGYFMMRFNLFDSLRDWSRNLADYFPFMSDGCIIEGWRRLIVRGERANPHWPEWRLNQEPPPSPRNPTPNRRRSDDPITDASNRFLEAHARGLPVFYFGLKKHLEGLLFCFDRSNDQHLKSELKGAAEDISATLARASSSAGLTTIVFSGNRHKSSLERDGSR